MRIAHSALVALAAATLLSVGPCGSEPRGGVPEVASTGDTSLGDTRVDSGSSGGIEREPVTRPALAAPTFAGTWDVTVAGTPRGEIAGVLSVLAVEPGPGGGGGGGGYGGTLSAEGASLPLKAVEVAGDGLTVTFYYPPAADVVEMDLRGAPDADALSGTTMGQYATTARRRP